MTDRISEVAGTNRMVWLKYLIYVAVLLYFGRELLVPVSFALLISFVLYPLCRWLEVKGIGRLMAVLISLVALMLAGLLVFALLISQFISFLDEWPGVYDKVVRSLNDLSIFLTDTVGLSADQQRHMLTRLSDQSGGNVLDMLKGVMSVSASSLVLLLLVPIYSILILYNRRYWMKVLCRLFPGETRENLHFIIGLAVRSYYNFVKGMAIVYLIVGILNSIGLLILGVPHAILFGFIASILTFIPYIGIMVGALLPITMAWITYDSVWYPVGIIGIFAFVQYIEANIIFPWAVSSRLNVNTIVMLFAIFMGNILWGVSGMILFVPFLGIAKLIADSNPKWKTVSMVLGVDDHK